MRHIRNAYVQIDGLVDGGHSDSCGQQSVGLSHL